jgi:hypothetical protein
MQHIFDNMHPRTRAKLVDLLVTAALIHETGKGDWRTYLILARNRTVGRVRSTLESVLRLNEDQFKQFVKSI